MGAVLASVTSTSPLLVRLDSSVTAVVALRVAAYTAVIGDRVAVVRLGSGLLVVGKVV